MYAIGSYNILDYCGKYWLKIMITYFYKILYKNKDVVYVGVTTTTVQHRFQQHIKSKGLNPDVYSVIEFDRLEHGNISSIEDYNREKKKVVELERKYIAEERAKGSNLLNISVGGEWGANILYKLRKEGFIERFGSYNGFKEYKVRIDKSHYWLKSWIYQKSKNKSKEWLRVWVRTKLKNKSKEWLRSWINQKTYNKSKKWLGNWIKHKTYNKSKKWLITWICDKLKNKSKVWLRSWIRQKTYNKSKVWLKSWINNRSTNKSKEWLRHWINNTF